MKNRTINKLSYKHFTINVQYEFMHQKQCLVPTYYVPKQSVSPKILG